MANPSSTGPTAPISDDEWLCTKQVAHLCGLGTSKVEKCRVYGGGPSYYRIGGKVLYKLSDVNAWVEACRVSREDSTNG